MTPPSPSCSPAIPHEPDHRVILASAGTGKTYQLTNRLIGLLVRGAAPSEIVATTFTRKAAGEIMERVVERLCEAATDAKARDALSIAIGLPLTHDRCLVLLRSISESLDRFGILTIDSFFQRLASVLSLEIGAGPDRRIADDAEDDSIRHEALEAALENTPPGEMAALVRLLYDDKPGAGVLRRLDEIISHGLTLLRETRHEPEIWGVSAALLEPTDTADASSASLGRIADEMMKADLPSNKDGTHPKKWISLQKDCADLFRSDQLDAFLDRAGKYILAGTFDKKEFPPQTLAVFRAALDMAVGSLDRKLAARTRAARAILERFDREYESLKSKRGVWRFEDVPRAVLAHIGTEGIEHAYFRLDGRVRHLLLDEFQDTSMSSFRLLEPLVGEIVAAEPPDRTFFCVGDVKQSLYAWNGAEPELLPAIAERWPQISRSSLSVSRRSSRAVLDAVNLVFGSLASNVGLAGNSELAERWDSCWVEHEAHDLELPGETTLLVPAADESIQAEDSQSSVEEGDSPDDGPAVAESEVSLAVQRVAIRRAQSATASIAILVRSNKSIAPIIHALAEAGIEGSEEGAASLLDAAPCGVIRSLLHLADHPSDTAARFHVASSPLGPCVGLRPDASEAVTAHVASSIRSDVERDGLASTLAGLIEATSDSMSPREHARCLSLIQLARRLDADGRAWCAEMVDAIDASRVRDLASTPVRVMTTHAAKGLEFDVVILTDLGSAMFRKSADIIGDRPEPLGAITQITCRPSPALQKAEPALDAIVARARNRVLMEGLCVLYVAMTRARHVLDVIVSDRSLKLPSKTSTTVYPGRLIAAALTGGCLPIESGGTQYHGTLGDWAAHVTARAAQATPPSPETATELTLRFARARTRPSGRLARVSPSSLEGSDSRMLSEAFRPVSDEGRSRGTLLHTLFEEMAWLEDGTPTDEKLLQLSLTVGATHEQAAEARAAFHSALSRPEIARWLSRDAFPLSNGETLDLWRERAFATRMNSKAEPLLLSGRFDRVVIRRDARGSPLEATLLDFKTDAVFDEDSMRQRAHHYAPQIRAYRDALVASTGLSTGSVRCILLFTQFGRAVSSSL